MSLIVIILIILLVLALFGYIGFGRRRWPERRLAARSAGGAGRRARHGAGHSARADNYRVRIVTLRAPVDGIVTAGALRW